MICEMRDVRCGVCGPLPVDNGFLTMSRVTSACNERTDKVSTHGSLIFVLLGEAQKRLLVIARRHPASFVITITVQWRM